MIELFFKGWVLVGYYLFPIRGRNDGEFHLSFEVGLVEAGENSVGIIWFKLSVYVLFCVDIDKTDTTVTVIVVITPIVYSYIVLSNFKCRGF